MQNKRFSDHLKLGERISSHSSGSSTPQQPQRHSVTLEIMGVQNQYADFEFDNVGPPVMDIRREELQMDVKSVTKTGTLPQHRRIRALRRQLEVSQLEVAQNAGISQSQYSLYEQGYVRLPLEVIQEIEALLHRAACRENGNG